MRLRSTGPNTSGPQKSQSGGKMPPKQKGNVVHLRAIPTDAVGVPKKTRPRPRHSLRQAETNNLPGLVMHLPESSSRQSSSSQDNHSRTASRGSQQQQQQQHEQQLGLQLDRLGHVEDRDDLPSQSSFRYSLAHNSLLESRTRSSDPSTQLQKPSIPQQHQQQQPRPTPVVVPEQSPYAAMDYLKSPVNWMSQMFGTGDQEGTSAAPKNPQNEQIFFSKSASLQEKERKQLLAEHNRTQIAGISSLAESVTGNYSHAGSLGSPSIASRTPTLDSRKQQLQGYSRIEVEPSSYQTFDIQKSLEKQLTELPDARPYNHRPKQNQYAMSNRIHSKDTSLGRKFDDSVSVLPTESIVSSPYGVIHTNNKMNVQTPNNNKRVERRKYLPQQQRQRCDTVKIDEGLVCVDPKNLKQQMRQHLRKKERVEPIQSGGIISAADLINMENNHKRKNKGVGGIKNKLKGIFHNSKEPNKNALASPIRAGTPVSQVGNNSSIEKSYGPPISDINKSKTLTHEVGSKASSNPSAQSSREGPSQEGHQVSKQLSPGINGIVGNSAAARPLNNSSTAKPGTMPEDLAPVFSEDSTTGTAKNNQLQYKASERQHMELVMPAEGKEPMYKVPQSEGRDDTGLEGDNENAQGTMANVGTKDRRKVFMDKLTSLAKDHIGPRVSKNKNNPSEEIVQQLGINPLSPSTYDGDDGSLSLGSLSLDTTAFGTLNHYLTGMFAKDQDTHQGQEAGSPEAIEVTRNGNGHTMTGKNLAVSEKETPRSKEQSLRDAKLMLMYNLKKKIIEELRKKKMREQQIARIRGELTADEEDKTIVTEEEVMDTFKKHLMAAKMKMKEGTGGEEHTDTDDRRKVTFAQQKTAFSDDEEEDISGLSSRQAQNQEFRLMSWAECGTSAADDSEYVNNDHAILPLAKKAEFHDLGSTALQTVNLLARSGIAKTQAKIKQHMEGACAVPACAAPERSFDDDSTYSSGILSGSSYSTSPQRTKKKSGAKGKDADRLDLVMSYSGSMLSGQSYVTRDTQAAESAFTEGTRDSYDTRDESYYSRDSRDHRRSRGRSSRHHHQHSSSRHRGSDRRGRGSSYGRRGPPSVMSDYTEYTDASGGGCRVFD